MIKRVCIYCASSNRMDGIYSKDAELLGRLLGQKGINVINGAGVVGLMGILSDAVLSSGGTVTGVIPKFMVDKGLCHPNLTEVIVTDTMHERKKKMADLSDAVIALPGGYGTMEELLEIITWRQLGIFTKPIIILNTLYYYNNLLWTLCQAVEKKFIREEHAQLWHEAKNPNEVIEILSTFF